VGVPRRRWEFSHEFVDRLGARCEFLNERFGLETGELPLSNCTMTDGSLDVQMRLPFNVLANVKEVAIGWEYWTMFEPRCSLPRLENRVAFVRQRSAVEVMALRFSTATVLRAIHSWVSHVLESQRRHGRRRP
jgi:hypothetical protein